MWPLTSEAIYFVIVGGALPHGHSQAVVTIMNIRIKRSSAGSVGLQLLTLQAACLVHFFTSNAHHYA